MIGYQNARCSTPSRLREDEGALVRAAVREGYNLGAIYVEPACFGPVSALPALIANVVRCRAAIGVSRPEDLGPDDRTQDLLIRQIEAETRRPVLVMAKRGAEETFLRLSGRAQAPLPWVGELRWR